MKQFAFTLMFLLAVAAIFVPAVQAEDSGDAMTRHYWHLSLDGFHSSDTNSVEAGYGFSPIPYAIFDANVGFLQDKKGDFMYSAAAVTGGGKAVYPLGLGNIYALAGGGLYFNFFHFNGDHATTTFPNRDNSTSFGYYFGVGGEMYTSRNVTAGIEAKRLELRQSFDKLKSSSHSSLGENNMSRLLVAIRITYNF